MFYSDSGKLQRVSELFLAVLFQRHRDVIYALEEGRFYRYSPETGLWEKWDEIEMEAVVTDFCNQLFVFLGCQEEAGQKMGHSMIMKVLSVLKSRVQVKEFFAKPEVTCGYWIHCTNCMLEYDSASASWTSKKFDPKYHSRFRCELAYDPGAHCDRFLKDLIAPAMSEADRTMLQLYAGQCLLGRNLSQKFLVITGTPGGGKSTLVNIIRKVIGQHNCAELRLEQSTGRFELSHYYGKTLLIGSDVRSSFLNNPGSRILKSLTGKDPLAVEWKCDKRYCETTGEFNILITSNSTLHVMLDNDRGAWERRMLWIRYKNKPPKYPIQDFDEVLLASEGSGILNWLLEGAQKLLRQNAKIELLPEQKERIKRLLEETDPVKIFVRDHIVLDEQCDMTRNELWTKFNIIREKMDFPPIKKQAFLVSLESALDQHFDLHERHDIKRSTSMYRGYSGIRFTLNPVSES